MTRSRARFAALLVAGGAALGLAARSLDLLPGLPWELAGLVSSIGAWGFAAVLTGFLAGTPRRGAIGGGVVLLVASLLYYAISFASGNWQTQFTDFTTDTAYPAEGLAVLVRSCLLWCAASLIGGPLLGYAGAIVRDGSAQIAALSAGATGGLLATGALAQLWSGLFWLGADVSAIIELGVVVIGIVVIFACRDGRRAWPTFAVALAVTALAATVVYTSIPSQGF